MSEYYIGVDIGGTSVKVGCFEKDGKLMGNWELPTRREDDGVNILPDIADAIKNKMEEINGSILGVGIGVPGPITEDGTVLKCANLGWGVFSVRETMQKLLGIENIQVGNDANVAALGEMWKGGGKGYNSIVMVTLGTGVGGGIILGGKILTGFKGAAGEIGHMKVNDQETEKCGCGNRGCLEQYASATGIVRMAKAHIPEDSVIYDREYLSAKMIFDGAKEGDEYCIEIVELFGKYLGTALSNVSCVVDTEAIVIGGGVSRAGQIILDVVSKWYNEKSLFALREKHICLAQLGNDAGIYGCVKMVMP